MTTSNDPKTWFDQFPLEGIGENSQWCARHWAPCPLLDANGMGAVVEVMSAYLATMPSGLTPEQLNENMAKAGKICCMLGDEKMYEIWGHWPPADPS